MYTEIAWGPFKCKLHCIYCTVSLLVYNKQLLSMVLVLLLKSNTPLPLQKRGSICIQPTFLDHMANLHILCIHSTLSFFTRKYKPIRIDEDP